MSVKDSPFLQGVSVSMTLSTASFPGFDLKGNGVIFKDEGNMVSFKECPKKWRSCLMKK